MRDDSFEKFGRSFQNRVIQAALIDYKFFQQIILICKPVYFNSETHRVLWNIIVDYFVKYNSTPTYEVIRIELGNETNADIVESVKVLLKEIETNVNQIELNHTKDIAAQFCTNKEMEQAILDSVELLKSDKSDAIKGRIEEAMKHVHVIDTGHEYFDALEERTKLNPRKTIPTGFKLLDHIDYLEGGLAGGELGVIMAPTGGGKSFWLTAIGKGALDAGKNVVHYTFELSEINIGKRYDSAITGIPTKNLKENYDDVEKMLANYKGGKLIIKEFPTRSANIHKIKFHIDRLISSGFVPDLIILDYADLMRSTRAYEQRTWELEAIYEELRGYGMETKTPIWTASQTNRGGLDEDIIGLDKIADAYSKAMVTDFIMTFSRNLVEKGTNKGKLYIAKNRIGLDGKVFNVEFHPETAQIKIIEMSDDAESDIIHNIKTDGGLENLFTKFRDER